MGIESTVLDMLNNGTAIEDILDAVERAEQNYNKKIAAAAAEKESIANLTNRLLEGKPTAEDVAYVFRLYAFSKWNKSEEVWKQIITGPEVESMTNMSIKMLNDFEPLRKMSGVSWEDIVKREKNKKSDSTIVRDFINTNINKVRD